MVRKTQLSKINNSKTKIVATIGPSSSTKEVLRSMIDNGLSCARINTAHGDFEQYKQLIEAVKAAGEIAVMMDIKGPEIRIRTAVEIQIIAGEQKEFFFSENVMPYFSFDFSADLNEDDVIFFDNGLIEAEVIEIKKGKSPSVILRFSEDCIIRQNKGVNVPGKKLLVPSLSEKDKESIKFAIEQNLSFIALSFARNKDDVLGVRDLLGSSKIEIIAKIENQEGIDNIDEIIEASDGIMVARGDMGVELPPEKVPYVQKMIVRKCNTQGKVVIVATQMMESMMISKTPTRAEVSDVANAVLDGADAVMLSGETATGKFPIIVVKTMHEICMEIEDKVSQNSYVASVEDISRKVCFVAAELALQANATKIVSITRSGFSARQIAKYRPSAGIIAVTDKFGTYLQMKLTWGITPVFIEKRPTKAITPTISQYLLEKDLLKNSDYAVFVGGIRTREHNVSNFIAIHKISDLLEFHKKSETK